LLDFFDGPRQGTQQLVSVLGYHDIVLETDSSDLSVFLQFGGVEAGRSLRVLQGSLYHEIDEVEARLNRNADSFLKGSAGAQFAQSCQFAAQRSFRISSDIVDLESEEMAESVGEEDGSNSLVDQLLHGPIVDDSHLDQVLEDDPFSE
jgi:hypothetical protein